MASGPEVHSHDLSITNHEGRLGTLEARKVTSKVVTLACNTGAYPYVLTCTATCDAGFVATNGWAASVNSNLTVSTSVPNSETAPTGWAVTVTCSSCSNRAFSAKVMCVSNQ